jgi:hypothetical protein
MTIFCNTGAMLGGRTQTQMIEDLRKALVAYYGVGSDGRLLVEPYRMFDYCGKGWKYPRLKRLIDVQDPARLAEEVVWQWSRHEVNDLVDKLVRCRFS